MFTYSVALYHQDGDYIGTASVEADTEQAAGVAAIAGLVGNRTELAALYAPKIVDQWSGKPAQADCTQQYCSVEFRVQAGHRPSLWP